MRACVFACVFKSVRARQDAMEMEDTAEEEDVLQIISLKVNEPDRYACVNPLLKTLIEVAEDDDKSYLSLLRGTFPSGLKTRETLKMV